MLVAGTIITNLIKIIIVVVVLLCTGSTNGITKNKQEDGRSPAKLRVSRSKSSGKGGGGGGYSITHVFSYNISYIYI